MASIIEIKGTEQTFTSANSFSSANSTQAEGWDCVRIINTSNTTQYIITVNYATAANITILPLGEIILEKPANTTITATNAALLGTLVAFKNN
jgi:hypothetical protein